MKTFLAFMTGLLMGFFSLFTIGAIEIMNERDELKEQLNSKEAEEVEA